MVGLYGGYTSTLYNNHVVVIVLASIINIIRSLLYIKPELLGISFHVVCFHLDFD